MLFFTRYCLFSLVFIFNGITFCSLAQPVFYRDDSIKVFGSNGQMLNPWAGGLNSSVFSTTDFDFDGKKDLVVFDKESAKIRCFKNLSSLGQPLYKHAPQYEYAFPLVSDWFLLTDYNADGKEDIFTYTTAGFRVFKNTSPNGGPLQFTLLYPLVYSNYNPTGTPNWLNLYCSSIGFPAISDLDMDGDLDVLTFSVFGTTIEYHQNKAIELGLPLDSLHFEIKDDCWGDFAENTCATTLNACPNFVKWNSVVNPAAKSNLHAGSCLTCFDGDGDGDKDLMLGDISCDSMAFYYNTGGAQNAHVDSTTKKFPASKPIKISYFPCSYYLDLDNDGVRDLLASPLTPTAAENFTSTWRYKNTGTDQQPVFSFEQNNFLQDSMLDFGTGAFPAIVDENGDGLPDIMVGNTGYFINPGLQSKIALLRNSGTLTQPAFTLITRNYANLSALNIQSMAPAFGDLDGDGDQDVVVGDFNGTLTYFQNTAGSGSPLNLTLVSAQWNNIDVGNNAMPQIIDVDRDGLKDLLIGGRNGKLSFFKNTGTASVPVFSSTATNSFFGGVNVCKPLYITGFASPNLRDVNGTYELIVGSERGYLYRYGNIDGNLNGTFSLIDSIGWNIWEGGKVAPFTGDLTADDIPELLLGNLDGGISFFKGDSLMSGFPNPISLENFNAFPNPANDFLTVRFNSKTFVNRKIQLFDISGKIVFETTTPQPVIELPLNSFSDGMYFLRCEENESVTSKKIIIRR